MRKFEGKVVVVTGGSRGIGEAITKSFVQQGAKVVVADVSAPVYEIENVYFEQLNVADYAACQQFAANVIAEHGGIDVLVNNAGITRDGMTAKLDETMWDLVVDVNLKGVFNLTKPVGKHMMEKGVGVIINVSSVAGLYGNIGQVNYSASKSGVVGLTKTWAKEFAFKGANIRVNAVAPGFIDTDMTKAIPDEIRNGITKMISLGRAGQPEEVAKAILFLAGEDASYVTGQVIEVAGGMRL